jgi:hypothetical protein
MSSEVIKIKNQSFIGLIVANAAFHAKWRLIGILKDLVCLDRSSCRFYQVARGSSPSPTIEPRSSIIQGRHKSHGVALTASC